ncbi:MAG: nucleotidyltransferase family protein [Oscillospiraceae bacterium]|nr:nucleotidyltransferase family protein [Oscillospiraceae bacterium]
MGMIEETDKPMLDMKNNFLHIAKALNENLSVVPLLFGSLGLEQRLRTDLNADDIDVLIPEKFLNDRWDRIADIMSENGYTLYDVHEHAFEKNGLSVAFASLESLAPFAGVDVEKIPVTEESGVRYLLLDLQDYLKVYTASLKDGYRKNVKNKNDQQKIDLINQALNKEV